MFDLDAAIDQWIVEATSASPELTPHANEIADHVNTVSLALIADGVAGPDALRQAVDSLGETSALAGEFRKQGSAIAYLRSLADPDVVPSSREYMILSISMVVLSFAWAVVMFVFDDSVGWAIPAWAVTTYLPLTVLTARGGVFNERSSSGAACASPAKRFRRR